jgi:DNA polymerase (family 10)
MATNLAAHIEKHTGAWVDVAGEVRRVTEWTETIDLVVVAEAPHRLERFILDTAVLADATDPLHARAHDGTAVSITPAVPEAAGTALIVATGPESHADVLSLDRPQPTEFEVYHGLGMPFIDPSARELPLSQAKNVITLDDIVGDLHVHSSASPDGRMSVGEILSAAIERGYRYIAVTDHTQGLRFGGLGEEAITAQADEIRSARARHPGISLYHGAELNIGPDGELDLDDEALHLLDFAVAGLHSHFGLDEATQTKRLITAIGHPVVRLLAHPLGRRIGARPAINVNLGDVIAAAVEHDVALEVNGHRDRLDLPANWIEVAAADGCLFAANSDSHRTGELDNITNAVATMQRAGLTPDKVVNALTADRFDHWVRSVRSPGVG